VDDRTHFEATFVRKPTYYAAFSAGEQEREQQRFGLGLLWNPVAGTVLQSQSRSEDAAWGTVMHNRTSVPWEAFPIEAIYTIDGTIVEPTSGAEDLTNGILEITYPLGSEGLFSGIGEKKLSFGEEVISVDVSHLGSFTEILPLVTDANSEISIDQERGIIQIFTNETPKYEKLRIEFTNSQVIESMHKLSARYLGSGMSVRPVHVKAEENLSYTITLNPDVPLTTVNEYDISSDMPEAFRIVSSYLNPFNPSTNVVFELGNTSDVTMEVFNVSGQRVVNKEMGTMNAGRHNVTLDVSNLTSGIYIVRMHAGNDIQTHKVTLIK